MRLQTTSTMYNEELQLGASALECLVIAKAMSSSPASPSTTSTAVVLVTWSAACRSDTKPTYPSLAVWQEVVAVKKMKLSQIKMLQVLTVIVFTKQLMPFLRPIYTVQLCRTRYAYDKSTTRIVSCKSNLQLACDCRVRQKECRGLLKHVLKPYDNRSNRQF